ncbi:hypothetical protein GCM10028812_00970 [Ancylobacter sonchi]
MNERHLLLSACLTMAGMLGAGAITAHADTMSTPAAPAYYVAEFEVADRDGIRPYSERVAATFEPFGGRFIVRGGQAEVKEGDGPIGRLVVIEFDSIDKARAWYNSAAYQEILPMRQRSGRSNTYIVQGLPK